MPPGRGHDDDAERHVDEKHRAPAETGEIERHQQTAEQEARRARKAEHDAVDAEGAAARFIGEQEMHGRQHLRHHQRRGGALRQPRHDQFSAGLRQPAPQRRQREAEHAGEEDVLRAVDVAEPAAGDDQRRIADQVDRDDGFDLRRRSRAVRPRWSGIATLTMKASTPNMNCAATTIASTPPAARQIDWFCDGLMHLRASLRRFVCAHNSQIGVIARDYLRGRTLPLWPDCCMAVPAGFAGLGSTSGCTTTTCS